jgi:Mg2+/citrate symporter
MKRIAKQALFWAIAIAVILHAAALLMGQSYIPS